MATADNIDKFFSSVTFEQASRAARNELPYTYQELLTKWDTSHRGRENFSLDNNNQAFDRKVLEAMKRAGGSLPLNRFNSPTKKVKLSWCPQFNTSAGCSNTQRAGGCTDQAGTEFKHGCNVKTNGRMCNSAKHNRLSH